MQVALEKIVVKPGQQLLLRDISWSDFEEILADLGEHRGSRISYSNGQLEIMVPLPEHEKHKEIIGDLIKILLEQLEVDFEREGCWGSPSIPNRVVESLASTTFKSESMNQALEADACFYIQNHQAVIGKDRLDLSIDPPPDLAIEIDEVRGSPVVLRRGLSDITNRTQFDNYLLLKVPELWRYSTKGLQIYLLQDQQYLESTTSPNFPHLPIIELIERHTKQAQVAGRSVAIRAFKQWIQENI
jgi:Uma2 family endonuclease